MNTRRTPAAGTTKGNFIAEWFGHRVWPEVDDSPTARDNQAARRCPFLSYATGESTGCIKVPRGGGEPTGVCTVSSDSNGLRQDWLACPYRVLDEQFMLLVEAVRTLYRIDDSTEILLVPVTVLQQATQRQRIVEAVASPDGRVFAFAADKLGGEVDIPETDSSPGAKVDVSIIEILSIDPADLEVFEFGQHVIFEIQTADFHGSPLHAVRLLQGLCPLGGAANYHDALKSRPEVCGTGMEGPNKANIFKRTIYQMILKVRMAKQRHGAGFVMLLPLSVWDSWQRHLGAPMLSDGAVVELKAPDEKALTSLESARAWIFIFDTDRNSGESPQPLKIVRRVATSESALLHYAFIAAADKGIEAGVIDDYRKTLSQRVVSQWNHQN